MSTLAQQEASRQNGARSTGPVTEEGKARSARNATKHGLTGGPVVLPHESQELYDNLKQCLGKTYRAASPAEWNLIDEMAAARWRLSRIETMETAILHEAFEKVYQEVQETEDEDYDSNKIMARAFAGVAENSKGFRMLDRHQRALWQSYDRALQELLQLQQMRVEQNEPEGLADYSPLPLADTYRRGAQFTQAAVTHVAKQNSALANSHPARSDNQGLRRL
jgi:hypothetical protein